MKRIPFSKEELNVVGYYPPTTPQGNKVEKLNTPISAIENLKAFISNETPLWMPNGEYISFSPSIIPDNIARGAVVEVDPPVEKGGKDMFGVEWEYSDLAGGSMVKPGNPLFDDANDWRKVLKFPDVSSWGWKNCAQSNRKLLETKDDPIWITQYTGLFERLISFMDFENAAVALIDDSQKDAIKDLFSSLCDLYEEIIDHYIEYFNMTGILFHDDWGSQMAPFFSLNTFREMIAPYIQRLTSYCHKKSVIFELHSCGHIELLMDGIVECGIDMWRPQPMNDIDNLLVNYGDRIKIGVRQPIFSNDATENEKIKAAKEMVSKYRAQAKSVYTMSHFQDPIFREALYEESRIVYNKLCIQDSAII